MGDAFNIRGRVMAGLILGVVMGAVVTVAVGRWAGERVWRMMLA